jgi:multidrug efflux pump subunit AcrA (membrane-fusion protein)
MRSTACVLFLAACHWPQPSSHQQIVGVNPTFVRATEEPFERVVVAQGQVSSQTSSATLQLAVFNVYQDDLPRIRRGAHVDIHVGVPPRSFAGEVHSIGALDADARTSTVVCSIFNSRMLKAGTPATAEISATPERRVVVPQSAIVRMADQSLVFVEKGIRPDGLDALESRPVSLDRASEGAMVPVLEGLESGERVLTGGSVVFLESDK